MINRSLQHLKINGNAFNVGCSAHAPISQCVPALEKCRTFHKGELQKYIFFIENPDLPEPLLLQDLKVTTAFVQNMNFIFRFRLVHDCKTFCLKRNRITIQSSITV